MRRNARQLGLACCAAVALAGALGRPAAATSVTAKSIEETVHDAGAVFMGRVLGHKTKWGNAAHTWMNTDYVFLVEDTLVATPQVQRGRTVTLNFWGGSLDKEQHEIAGLALPKDGERAVVMLRPDWQNPGLTPVVGLHQGFFRAQRDPATGKEMLADAGGAPILKSSAGGMVRGLHGEAARPGFSALTLEEFAQGLKAALPRMRALKVQPEAAADPGDPRVLKPFALQAEKPGARRSPDEARAEDLADAAVPAGGSPSPRSAAPAAEPAATEPGPTSGDAPARSLAGWTHYDDPPDWPIVINQFPSSATPWSPEDVRQIAKWNHYCDVFRVRQSPTGTYGFGNGRNDMSGFLNSSQLSATYGRGWNAGEQAVTFTRKNIFGQMTESDVIFNAGRSWTLDDEWVYSGGPALSFRATLVHELGHVFGGQHNFNFMSIMNYAPAAYRGYAMPYMDDAENIRVQYGGHNFRRADLGVSLYRSNGYQTWQDATFPAQVTAGERITVNNYHLENVGTETYGQPRVEWYLSVARNSNAGTLFYSLGATTYGSLARYRYFDPASVARTLTVPANVKAGRYYLCAFLRNDGDGGFFSYLNNNYGWSRTQITVLPRLASVAVTPSPLADQNQGTARVSLSNVAGLGSVNVALSSSNPGVLSVPATVTIPANASAANVTVRTGRVTAPTSVQLRASYNGRTVTTTVTVRVGGDAYEHDDSRAEARPIAAGQTQYHSIHRAPDEDWATFVLNQDAVVDVITSSGSAANTDDTELWVYQADGTTIEDYNDDPAGTRFARCLGMELAAGRYYTRVRSYNNRTVIPTYAIRIGIRPEAPSGLAADAVSPTEIDLSWSDNANNETGYRVERQRPDGSWAALVTLGANAVSYRDTTVVPETTYTYRVRAEGTSGPSLYSDEASATTPAAEVRYTVSGTVFFYNQPLEGAEVRAAGQSVVTGPDGTYSLSVPAGTVTIEVLYSGPYEGIHFGGPRTIDLQADISDVNFIGRYP